LQHWSELNHSIILEEWLLKSLLQEIFTLGSYCIALFK